MSINDITNSVSMFLFFYDISSPPFLKLIIIIFIYMCKGKLIDI